MSLFFSTQMMRIDRKGRVSVPAQFRNVLSAQGSAGQLVLFPSRGVLAIEGCSLSRVEQLSERLDHLEIDSAEREAIEVLVFGQLMVITMDPEGRIIVPEEFARHAGLEEEAAFTGLRHSFQIWRPDRLAERRKELDTPGTGRSLNDIIAMAIRQEQQAGDAT